MLCTETKFCTNGLQIKRRAKWMRFVQVTDLFIPLKGVLHKTKEESAVNLTVLLTGWGRNSIERLSFQKLYFIDLSVLQGIWLTEQI